MRLPAAGSGPADRVCAADDLHGGPADCPRAVGEPHRACHVGAEGIALDHGVGRHLRSQADGDPVKRIARDEVAGRRGRPADRVAGIVRQLHTVGVLYAAWVPVTSVPMKLPSTRSLVAVGRLLGEDADDVSGDDVARPGRRPADRHIADGVHLQARVAAG